MLETRTSHIVSLLPEFLLAVGVELAADCVEKSSATKQIRRSRFVHEWSMPLSLGKGASLMERSQSASSHGLRLLTVSGR